MRNRILKVVWTLAVCLPTLAMAQQQPEPERGTGTWEFSLGGGISILDAMLRGYLGNGAPSTRFNNGYPGVIAPTVGALVGYNFNRHLGFSLGGEATFASSVSLKTEDAALTYTWNLSARTNPFILGGMELTRIDGLNDRATHSTWGAMGGVGVRQMVGKNLAVRLEGRMRLEGYQELPAGDAWTSEIRVGLSYFVGGRRPAGPRMAATEYRPPRMLARVDTVLRVRVDTVVRVRVDTLRFRDTVHVTEPTPDQLVLRVQFETDKTVLLRKSRPVLDTIALAIIATPGSRWQVQGHTDSVGTREHNQTLSEGRAQSVVNYLVSRGVDRNILTAIGYGYSRPVFSNSTVYGRAQNRRVQLRRIPAPPTGPPVR
jgi:outer membrane protein OmpA-like peptidoglycan-associated protein